MDGDREMAIGRCGSIVIGRWRSGDAVDRDRTMAAAGDRVMWIVIAYRS